MRFTIRLGGFNPPKTLSIYAPFGAGICNTLCTANTCLHYCWYYRIIICITSGITFLSFVIPSVLASPDLSYYKSAKKAITSSDTSSQELSGTSPKHGATSMLPSATDSVILEAACFPFNICVHVILSISSLTISFIALITLSASPVIVSCITVLWVFISQIRRLSFSFRFIS